MGSRERKDREKNQRRKAILDATRTLLLKKGIDNISMRKIAEIAELGLGTIYSYFSSKEEIYAALSEEVFDLMHEKSSTAGMQVKDPAEKIRRIAQAYRDFNRKNTSYYNFLDFFISTPKIIFPPDMKQHIDRYGNKLLDPIAGAIEEGIRKKAFNPTEPKIQAMIFLGTIHGVLHFKKLQNTMLSPAEFEKCYTDAIEGFIKSLS